MGSTIRFTGEAEKIEPIDFGLDIDGAKYNLRVADVSVEQLKKIEANPVKSLPKNWKLDGRLIWDRRGRRK